MESSTKILRRLLDERGVKHEGGERSVRWRDRNGVIMQAFPLASGELGMEVWSCTPEQAVAATLGSEEAYTREDVEGAFVSGYSLGSLPVGSDPRWDENSQTVDEHMAELGWVRAATLGDTDATAMRQDDAGTCENTQDDADFMCSVCGKCVDNGRILGFNFCPNCGRRVVSE